MSIFTYFTDTLCCSGETGQLNAFLKSNYRPKPLDNKEDDNSNDVQLYYPDPLIQYQAPLNKKFNQVSKYHPKIILHDMQIDENPLTNHLNPKTVNEEDIICRIDSATLNTFQNSQKFTLRLSILKATHLPQMDTIGNQGERCDPFYKIWIEYKGKKQDSSYIKSDIVPKTQNPVFPSKKYHSFQGIDIDNCKILIKLYDADIRGLREKEIGFTRFDLKQVNKDNYISELTEGLLTEHSHQTVIDEYKIPSLIYLSWDWRNKEIFSIKEKEENYWVLLRDFFVYISLNNTRLSFENFFNVRCCRMSSDDEEIVAIERSKTRLIYKTMDIDNDNIVSRNDCIAYCLVVCTRHTIKTPLYNILNLEVVKNNQSDLEHLQYMVEEAKNRYALLEDN